MTELSELDVAIVGHLDGHGRSVLWHTPGVRGVAGAISQAAIVPAAFDNEPGWILRKMSDGRAVFLVGGTRNAQLADSFGRSGIFHGIAVIGSEAAIATILGSDDPMKLARSIAKVKSRGMGSVAGLTGPAIASWGAMGDLPANNWVEAKQQLSSNGIRPFAGPINGTLVHLPDVVDGGPVAPVDLHQADATIQKILTSWA